ncbi:ParA family protein, partial [Vibrio parahaemolyticus]|nr:ParA family protein [Vibrio parahaemolyticus]
HRCKTDLELAKLISNIKSDVIIDCGGYDNDLNSIAISAADIVIVPAKESALELNGLKKFNSILQRISKKSHRQITGFVFPCRNHHAKKKFPLIERTCELNSNLQLICSPVAQRAAIDDAAWLGCSLAEIDAQEPGAKEFEQLSKQLEVITNGKV